MPAKKKITFEGGIARLESIAAAMESSDLPLEDLMALYEEGIKLSKELQARLNEAENRMRLVHQGDGDTLQTEDITAEMKG